MPEAAHEHESQQGAERGQIPARHSPARSRTPGGRRRLRHPVERDAPDLDRLGNVLDPVRAHRLERERELRLHLVVDVAGDADAAGLRQTLQARRHIDPVAQDVAVLDDDVADVDPDAELDAPVLGLGLLALGHAVLDHDGAFDRVDGARELDQRAVPDQLDHAAAVLGDEGLDEFLAQSLQARDRAGFIGSHEPAIANHVRGQNRHELPFHTLGHEPASTHATTIGSSDSLSWSSRGCRLDRLPD
jgi:hypothetical protein